MIKKRLVIALLFSFLSANVFAVETKQVSKNKLIKSIENCAKTYGHDDSRFWKCRTKAVTEFKKENYKRIKKARKEISRKKAFREGVRHQRREYQKNAN